MMVEGEEWRPLVPRKVAEVIDYVDGVRRLREISGGE
jgi:nicotinamide mononucleotide adenylyltransferase